MLGAAVGFIPGIAVTYPLTGSDWAGPDATTTDGLPVPDHFLDVPWLLIGGLVIGPAAAHRPRRRAGVALAAADGEQADVTDVRREQRAARRRTLRVLTDRRLATLLWTLPHQARRQSGVSESTTSTAVAPPLAHASISSTGRMPTDS